MSKVPLICMTCGSEIIEGQFIGRTGKDGMFVIHKDCTHPTPPYERIADLERQLEIKTLENIKGKNDMRDLKQQLAEAKQDMNAYKGALGYPVSGEYVGNLTNGEWPKCGMCDAMQDEITKLKAERDDWKQRFIKLDGEENQEVIELEQRCARLEEALGDLIIGMNNILDEVNHKDIRLRKHPIPCNTLDFCVMSDAKKRIERAKAALEE